MFSVVVYFGKITTHTETDSIITHIGPGYDTYWDAHTFPFYGHSLYELVMWFFPISFFFSSFSTLLGLLPFSRFFFLGLNIFISVSVQCQPHATSTQYQRELLKKPFFDLRFTTKKWWWELITHTHALISNQLTYDTNTKFEERTHKFMCRLGNSSVSRSTLWIINKEAKTEKLKK